MTLDETDPFNDDLNEDLSEPECDCNEITFSLTLLHHLRTNIVDLVNLKEQAPASISESVKKHISATLEKLSAFMEKVADKLAATELE